MRELSVFIWLRGGIIVYYYGAPPHEPGYKSPPAVAAVRRDSLSVVPFPRPPARMIVVLYPGRECRPFVWGPPLVMRFRDWTCLPTASSPLCAVLSGPPIVAARWARPPAPPLLHPPVAPIPPPAPPLPCASQSVCHFQPRFHSAHSRPLRCGLSRGLWGLRSVCSAVYALACSHTEVLVVISINAFCASLRTFLYVWLLSYRCHLTCTST